MNSKEMLEYIEGGALDARLSEIYGDGSIDAQRVRYAGAVERFCRLYGYDREVSLFSVSGRSELSGNHTDHNHGCVIAASIDLDIIAVASAREDMTIRVKSEGFAEDVVDISKYRDADSALFGTSASIIAGMSRGFVDSGYAVGGFDAYTTSNVLKGSGLSSSAAFEDMIGNIMSHTYNNGAVDKVEIAKLAQFTENVFFGKPSGLMDQAACAVGGIVAIDFEDPRSPVIEKLDIDITGAGYNLCIVNTGGNHADLTDDYADIPREMKAVAAEFGAETLRSVSEDSVIAAASALRAKLGDRAVLRAIHFFEENKRVARQKEALKNGNIEEFFKGVKESGRSSFCYLQNVYTNKNVSEQGLSLALCLADIYLGDKSAAWRVHGGGFAGTIQAFIHENDVEGFRRVMDNAFGDGKCMVLKIRAEGALKVI